MSDTLDFNGDRYISSKRAAQLFGYTKDYVGQLCRNKKIESRLVGRTWYVSEKELRAHKLAVHRALHQPMHERGSTQSRTDEVREQVEVRSDEVRSRAVRPRVVPNERPRPSSSQGLDALTHLDVSYLPEDPVYYEDDRPVNLEPVRVTRFEQTPIVAPATTARVRTVHTAPTRLAAPARATPAPRQSGAPRSDGIAPVRRSGVPQRSVEDFGHTPRRSKQSERNAAERTAPRRAARSKAIPVILGVLVGLAAIIGYVFFSPR